MKKGICALVLAFFFPLALCAQAGGREIENSLAAVRAANAGDYIVLRSGRRYVLTRAEIDIARGSFDYNNISVVQTETRDDGATVKTISQAHTVVTHPDDQSVHLLKTNRSFSEYMKYIEKNYYPGQYIDTAGRIHDTEPVSPPPFSVFRTSVHIQTISDGEKEVERVIITAYNHNGQNFRKRYYSEDGGWQWGNISGAFRASNEPREIEFNAE